MRGPSCLSVLFVLLLSAVTARAEDPPSFSGWSAEQWEAALSSDHPQVTVKRLADGGAEAAKVCAYILTRPREKGSAPPVAAVDALTAIGPAAKEEFDDLLRGYVKGTAVSVFYGPDYLKMLIAIDRDSKDLRRALKKDLHSRYEHRQELAAITLATLGESSSSILGVLSRGIRDRRLHLYFILDAVACLGPKADKLAGTVAPLLRDDEYLVRMGACRALLAMGEKGDEELEDGLEEAADDVQILIAYRMGSRGADAKSAVPSLESVLRHDSEPYVRAAAALALGMIGPDARAAADGLADALGDDEDLVRQHAARALSLLGDEGERRLRIALHSSDPKVVEAAGRGIALLEEPGNRVVEALVDALARERTAEAAVDTLGHMGDEIIPILIEGLEDSRAPVRAGCARALGMHAEKAKAAVPGLESLLKDPNEAVGEEARKALHWIRGD